VLQAVEVTDLRDKPILVAGELVQTDWDDTDVVGLAAIGIVTSVHDCSPLVRGEWTKVPWLNVPEQRSDADAPTRA
jgi:hypothetical protein